MGKTKSIAITIVVVVATVMLSSAGLTMAPANNAFAYKSSQAGSLANACGNGDDPFNILCQNLFSQIKGDHNAVNIIGFQTGGSGERNGRDGGGGGVGAEPPSSPSPNLGTVSLSISLDCKDLPVPMPERECAEAQRSLQFQASYNAPDPIEVNGNPLEQAINFGPPSTFQIIMTGGFLPGSSVSATTSSPCRSDTSPTGLPMIIGPFPSAGETVSCDFNIKYSRQIGPPG